MYKKGNKIVFDKDELTKLRLYCQSNKTQKEIAKEFGVSICTIRSICKENNIITSTIRKKKVDESFFDIIDTEEKAYWLGFIYADGCIYANVKNGNYILHITVTEKDKEIIHKFSRSIKSEHKIRQIKPSVFNGSVSKPKIGITVSSKKIYDSLKKLGVSENKSLKLNIPNISSKFHRHFVRGYFDGDGSVYTHLSGKSKTGKVNIIGSTSFMKWMSRILPLDTRLYKEKRVVNMYYISIHRKNSVSKFYYYLYSDSHIYLERKKKKYDEVMLLIEEPPETEMAPSLPLGR